RQCNDDVEVQHHATASQVQHGQQSQKPPGKRLPGTNATGQVGDRRGGASNQEEGVQRQPLRSQQLPEQVVRVEQATSAAGGLPDERRDERDVIARGAPQPAGREQLALQERVQEVQAA